MLQQEMGGCLHTNLLAIHSEGVVADPLAAGWIWVFLVWDLSRAFRGFDAEAEAAAVGLNSFYFIIIIITIIYGIDTQAPQVLIYSTLMSASLVQPPTYNVRFDCSASTGLIDCGGRLMRKNPLCLGLRPSNANRKRRSRSVASKHGGAADGAAVCDPEGRPHLPARHPGGQSSSCARC